MDTNEEMNMKPTELAQEQLEQVTGGAADGARCVNGLNRINVLVCENCENYTCSDDGVKYCAIGVTADIPHKTEYRRPSRTKNEKV